ncbi:MAG: sulfatase-like hydrolase/transferase [bacterium]|nr:sulfatase-like hydrolase/transferase [bacterium]
MKMLPAYALCSVLAVGCALSHTAEAASSPPAPTTVILLTVDTLRADSLSFMGCPHQTSPFLDSLASRAVVFDRAYSTSSWTVPGIASMFTSQYPSSHGVVRGEVRSIKKSDEVWEQTALAPSLTTLAELFRKAGYRTIGVAANRHVQVGTGFEQGFDHYFGPAEFFDADQLNSTLRETMAEAFGKNWREVWKKEKVFLWIHYFDPHHFYSPRRPWIGRWAPDFRTNPKLFPWRLTRPDLNARFARSGPEMVRRIEALYHSEIRFTDEQIRTIFGELAPDDGSLIVFTSDHGEELGEHGSIGHRLTLYEETVRVPMFVYRPSVLPQGKRIEEIVNIIDILPTLAEMVSFTPPDGSQGRSLLPLISGKRKSGEGTTFLELHPPFPALRAVVTDRWKLLQSMDSENPPILYDLATDPGELNDLAAKEGRRVRRLERRIRCWLDRLPAAPETILFSTQDQEEIERLRALGYVE